MSKAVFVRALKSSLFYIPGVLLISIAVAVLFAPDLILCFIAAFFLFLGSVGCYLGWRLLIFKDRVEGIVKDLEARIVIQGVGLRPTSELLEEMQEEDDDDPESEESVKKVLYH